MAEDHGSPVDEAAISCRRVRGERARVGRRPRGVVEVTPLV